MGRKTDLFNTPDDTVNGALRRLMKGQERRALRSLCSNGVATINPSTIAAVTKLHPARKEDLKLPPSSCEQLCVEEKDVADRLFSDAGDPNLSKDVYGWASWLFYPWRGEPSGFFASLVRFVCLIANKSNLFPPVCAVMLGSGALTPLHKLSKEEQAQFEGSGLEPKIRPVNSGSLLAKAVLSSVLRTPAAHRAFDRVGPQQLSLGTPRGIERLIHSCRAAYETKWLVCKNDFQNGFNSLSRQCMLDSNAQLFPESTNVVNFFYGVDAPVYLLDDELDVTTVWSSEGPRQGCSAGTYLFCAGITPVVTRLKTLYPDFTFLVLTDDINILLPPPQHDSFEEWQKLYRRYAALLADLKTFSCDYAGLTLNTDKCGMLLPEGAPLPSEETRAAFPPGFDFNVQGFRVAGSPIGTHEFMCKFVEEKLAESVSKLHAIKGLGSKCARATHKLLVTCGTKLMNFLSSTVPPSIMSSVLDRFDAHVDSVFFGTLSPTGFTCSAERLERAKLRVSLPAPYGCSLFRVADQGKVAWLSSVAACFSDPVLFRLRDGLRKFIDPAFDVLVCALGGVTSKHWTLISHLVPSTVAGFLDGSVYSPSNDFKIKISKVVLKLLSQMRTDRFMSLVSVGDLSDTLSKADVLRAHAQTLAGRIFTTSLNFDAPFVLTNEQYLAWCCAFLGLPPSSTVGNHSDQKGFDYPVQSCLAIHRGGSIFLDADGCHAASGCPATYAGRMRKHNYLARVLARAAKEAGLRVNVEPDTHGLLLGEFSKSACRRIFPRNVSKVYRGMFNAVMNAIELVASPACAMDEAAKYAYVQTRIDALPSVKKEDTTGLRIDVSIENEVTGETRWVDVTAVHTGSPSYQDKELKTIRNRQITAQVSSKMLVPDPLKLDPSPTLVERTTAKNEKYARLLLVARKQTVEKKRKQVPVFSTFAVSDYGELAPVATDLLEWLVQQFRLSCEKAGRRSDGCKPLELTRSFRRRLYIGVQLALVAGFGEMLCRAGQAWG